MDSAKDNTSGSVSERLDEETERLIEDYAARYRDFFWMQKSQEMAPPNHHERQDAEDERHGAHKRLYDARVALRQRILSLIEEARTDAYSRGTYDTQRRYAGTD